MAETSLVNPSAFIEDAKAILDRADECRKEKTRVQSELKQCERAAASMDKAIADSIGNTQKRKKEALAAGYDEKLSICQNRIKDCRAERGKAKADAVAERIQRENSHLEHDNTELQQQIEQLYAENNVKTFCKKHMLVVLFFPKRIQDWLTAAAVCAVLLFLVPLLMILGMNGKPFTLAFMLFVYLCCLFAAYLYMLYKYMILHRHVHMQAEELKARMKENTRKMNSVAANIRKSQDETGYNLRAYDDRIAELEEEIREILAERKSALDMFERVTRGEIAQEVAAASAEQKAELDRQLQEKQLEADEKTKELDQVETEIRDVYEARLGKDLMHRQKLSGLGTFCQENPELPLEQAIDCYRSTKR